VALRPAPAPGPRLVLERLLQPSSLRSNWHVLSSTHRQVIWHDLLDGLYQVEASVLPYERDRVTIVVYTPLGSPLDITVQRLTGPARHSLEDIALWRKQAVLTAAHQEAAG